MVSNAPLWTFQPGISLCTLVQQVLFPEPCQVFPQRLGLGTFPGIAAISIQNTIFFVKEGDIPVKQAKAGRNGIFSKCAVSASLSLLHCYLLKPAVSPPSNCLRPKM